MIVIAIVAILVALAVPAYQDYTKRAKFTECLAGAAPAKLSISEFRLSGGAWPTIDQSGINLSAVGECKAQSYSATTGAVTVESNSGGKATLTPTDSGSITWACSNGGLKALAKYLPSSCRDG